MTSEAGQQGGVVSHRSNNFERNNRLREMLMEAVERELAELDKDEAIRVLENMGAITQSGLYMFFAPAAWERYTQAMTNHLAIRKFWFGLHVRLNALLLADATFGGEDRIYPAKQMRNLADQILFSWCDSFTSSEANQIPEPVVVQILPTKADLSKLLNENPWIITLYLAVATGAFQDVVKRLIKT